MANYQIINECCVLKTDDGTIIPIDNGNSDYQQYITWLAEGNIPLPAKDIYDI